MALANLARHREAGEPKALVVLASGLGKTAVSAFDVSQFEREVGRRVRVLYLAHQSVILDQARRTFADVLGPDRSHGRFDGELHDHDADLLFATFQSMHNHRSEFERNSFDYMIVDEAHHTAAPTRDGVVAHFRSRFRLGLTATPFRSDGQDILQYYGDVVAIDFPLERAIAQGLLAPIDYRMCTDPIDPDALERALRSAGRVRGGGVFRHQNDRCVVEMILQAAPVYGGRRRILVFCASLDQMHHFARLLPDARTISGEDSRDDQIATVTDFNDGAFEVLLSRDVLNEGIDIPDASTLVFLRNTESPVVFLQQLGRGLRVSPGKRSVVVLDFVDNVQRIEFAYTFMSRLEAEQERVARETTNRPPPRSTLTLDQTAHDVLSSLIRKKIDAGLLTSLDGISQALEGRVSTATLRRIAMSGDFPPDVDSLAFTGSRTLYFNSWVVARLMRQVYALRIPEGLIRDAEIAGRSGQSLAWLRRQQQYGRLPAAWFHRRANGHFDFFYEVEDIERARSLAASASTSPAY
jgi:superfamily II DNA or RNA helicase